MGVLGIRSMELKDDLRASHISLLADLESVQWMKGPAVAPPPEEATPPPESVQWN